MNSQQPDVGDIVHYVVAFPSEPQCRPGIVLRKVGSAVRLSVFLDSDDPKPEPAPDHAEAPFVWQAGPARFSKEHATGTWHWPHGKP